MKRLGIILFFASILTACGGSGGDSGTSPATGGSDSGFDQSQSAQALAAQALVGLWGATSVSVEGAGSVPVNPGEMYISVEGVSGNSIQTTFFTLEGQNCLESDADLLTNVGGNNYEDSFGDIAEFVVNGNDLEMTFRDIELDGIRADLSIQFERFSGVTVADIPVCSDQSGLTDNNLFNDSPNESLITEIINSAAESVN